MNHDIQPRDRQRGRSESAAADALRNVPAPGEVLRNPVSGTRSCQGCGAVFGYSAVGRPQRFCSSACRQRAYRARKDTEARPRVRPFWSDAQAELYVGDAGGVLAGLPSASVQAVVTSPPYYGLRDYEGHPGQLGNEDTPVQYVEALVRVFAQLERVLRPDGTVWLNLGDTYSARADASVKQHAGRGHQLGVAAARRVSTVATARRKSLLMMPARVAIALTDAGWIVRNDVVWHKPNARPESVMDRLSAQWEHLLLLTRSERYFFDRAAIAERAGSDVWRIPTTPRRDRAHFARFPLEVPSRCVLASTRPGDVVLDPFSGHATTGLAARQHGRRYIGIDLVPTYCERAAADLAQTLPIAGTVC